MSSMRFAEAFRFGFPWKTVASVAKLSFGIPTWTNLHLRGLRPQISSLGALRLEVRAMPLLLDDHGRPRTYHWQLRLRVQWCEPQNGESLVSAEIPDTKSVRSWRRGKGQLFISGRLYRTHLSVFSVALYDWSCAYVFRVCDRPIKEWTLRSPTKGIESGSVLALA